VIKVNGDYRDPRIRNTPRELGSYGAPMNTLLHRVFDDFGAVVCGWSGSYDVALRKAIERCSSQRFSWYWTYKDTRTEDADKLIRHRSGQTIKIPDADAFFTSLSEKVLALEDSSRSHPMSVAAAVGALKRYVAEERHRVHLHDLVTDGTEHCLELLRKQNAAFLRQTGGTSSISDILRGYAESVEMVQALLAHGCYWSDVSLYDLWARCIERVANSREIPGTSVWIDEWTRMYPAAILLYVAGVSSLAGNRPGLLAHLLTKIFVRENGERSPLVLKLGDNWRNLGPAASDIPKYSNSRVPFSDHLFDLIRPSLQPYLPDDGAYDEYFDRFEYMLSMTFHDLWIMKYHDSARGALPGRFTAKMAGVRGSNICNVVLREAEDAGEAWAFFRAGLFGGNKDRLLKASEAANNTVRSLPG
jgi:hypothetical protein